MTSKGPILECVPNFSEGRDPQKIQAIADAIHSVSGAQLLHIDTSPAANRTVMTFAGEPGAVCEAAFQAVKKAAEVIDMTKQEGVHPRIGATDVCPLIPLYDMTVDQAIALSRQLGERIGRELNISIYLYEQSATAEHRRALPDIRKGQYEKFAEKMKLAEWKPDYGPLELSLQTGATVIGVRDVLVAFNISLKTNDVNAANYIADRIRERGYYEQSPQGRLKVPGLLPKLRAIGWYMADFQSAQVSMNLLDYRITSPLKAWEATNALAQPLGVEVIGCEVVGLIPETCLLEAGAFTWLREGKELPHDKELLVHAAIEHLGLNRVKPFDPQEKVLEYALKRAGLI
ncbi:glutamate formimidoyltransferase [Polluticoccus soli]|uniref:glutamate formimidoyltransferase n=1 Tax=Polluticoccus soli TaxID=3034150 RepID=UPI0023E2ED32|nr:glutamate formimidoyltransferase [Flavipsychrobacter sp. JY13-12]